MLADMVYGVQCSKRVFQRSTNLYARTPPAPCHRRPTSRLDPRGVIPGFRPGPKAALAGGDMGVLPAVRRKGSMLNWMHCFLRGSNGPVK